MNISSCLCSLAKRRVGRSPTQPCASARSQTHRRTEEACSKRHNCTARWDGPNGKRDAIALPAEPTRRTVRNEGVRKRVGFCASACSCSAPHPARRRRDQIITRERGHQKAATRIPMVTENIISAHHMFIKNNTDQVSAMDKSFICSRGKNSRPVIDGRSSFINSARSGSVRCPAVQGLSWFWMTSERT